MREAAEVVESENAARQRLLTRDRISQALRGEYQRRYATIVANVVPLLDELVDLLGRDKTADQTAARELQAETEYAAGVLEMMVAREDLMDDEDHLLAADMIEAGVGDLVRCTDVMEEALVLMRKGDYMMAGENGNSHGAMITFPGDPQHEGMPKDGPDRRFMAMPAYLGGRFGTTGDHHID